jgi:TRAP-type mannitol/chloroaromatic compound transport system permease small subunit
MPAARLLIKVLDAVAEGLGRFAALFAGLMVLVTCYIVLTRYAFNFGSVAVQETVTYMNAILFTLGAAYTLKHDGHVRVDIFYGPASARTKAWINLLGSVLLLLPVAVFILWACWNYVVAAWAVLEKSPDTGGLPFVYLLKSLMPAMAVLLVLQAVAEALRNALRLLDPAAAATAGTDEGHEEDSVL